MIAHEWFYSLERNRIKERCQETGLENHRLVRWSVSEIITLLPFITEVKTTRDVKNVMIFRKYKSQFTKRSSLFSVPNKRLNVLLKQ